MSVVTTLAERILEAIRFAPLDDDVLAKRLGVPQRQAVNQVARRLAADGRLRRYVGPDGKLVNGLPETQAPAARTTLRAVPAQTRVTEDEVKEAVRAHLAEQGFEVAVAWGRTRGIDIDARHPDGRHLIIEAKAEAGHNGPQQVNYFLGMLGELVQRMTYPEASYGIALPDNRQYRGLVDRLPALARQRLQLIVFWVARTEGALTVEVDS